ncbi:hypothetical protein LJB78_00805 [Bacteroidales bacterium OttesenSCG-928-J16]|nr:hypothetical protein [Bacteroidales bacterium OttesenSCG-928-J16]
MDIAKTAIASTDKNVFNCRIIIPFCGAKIALFLMQAQIWPIFFVITGKYSKKNKKTFFKSKMFVSLQPVFVGRLLGKKQQQ